MNQFLKSGIYRDYLADYLLPKCENLLDVGSGTGRFISQTRKARHKFACDVDDNSLVSLFGNGKKNKRQEVVFKKTVKVSKIPFPSGKMDVVTCLEVLEHVYEKDKFISEIGRVLKKGGILVVSVPHNGWTSFIDWGNFKYKLPKLHRVLVILFKGKDFYVKKYKSGMNGDMDPRLGTHQHFSVEQMNKLLSKKFKIVKVIRYGLFVPFILPIRDLYQMITKQKSKFFAKIINLDAKLFDGDMSYSMVVKAVKK